ncbi:hypothetical protein QCG_4065, partial [Clostridioides difficile CD43]
MYNYYNKINGGSVMIIGYERVSTRKQDNSRQERVLENEG